ncbi:TonB-dependent receptor [Aureibaculum sp. 2210JD6-5]|uniref:SusC/RagA family TonB-linked outer membrane protein n=1 Tax=Aureibaculum sp. 2210JD6-5 TaxID=3103957 RepID=UPI002AAEED00|nr:TonB-dependent receptor [Aureibaculum sp. 2210JD6-5]MDY7395148.1 TonB-dependent receptor [Aureibaculum sp. 2210JD6-5]
MKRATKGYILLKGRNNFKVLSFLLLILFVHQGWAQSIKINGTVKDAETNQPLPGASVLIKGTTIGVETDFDGNYTIDVPSKEAVLKFSFVSFQTQEIVVGDKTTINVTLQVDSQSLEEVVVVGYGTQKKVNLSGSVEVVDMKKLEDRPTANVSQGLQGTVANLNITFANGAPGGTASINIRGYTSINGGSPLVLIDGVPSSEEDLTRMNPDDIASISVLKDASSAAIYGARAAFGVLLVTTKEGGKNKITYSNSLIWGKPTITPDPITDPYIFSRLLDISTNNTPWDYVNYTDETYAWARDRSNDPTVPNVRLDPQNPDRWQYMGDTNWNDYFFNKSAFSQNHNVSMSGKKVIVDPDTKKSESIGYYLSANHTVENGLNRLAEDVWERNAIRSKINLEPYEWMDFENNTFLSLTKRNLPTYGLTNVYNLRPTDVVKNPDGSWANTNAGRAAARMIDGGKTEINDTGIQTTNKLNIYLFDRALKLTAEHTYKKDTDRRHWDGTKYKIGYGPNDIREQVNEDYAYEAIGENIYNVLNLYATYTKEFNKHNFTGLIGYNKEVNKYEWFSANRDDLISSDLPNLALATGDQTVGWFYSDWAINGIFGRLNYIFNERYILELNGRYDGSSRFPKSNRYGFSPSLSAAWIVSKDLGESVTDVMNHLKLRASRGSLGNQNVGNYGYINSLGTGQSGYLIDGDYPKAVYAPGLGVNPDNYTWEKVVTTNFGVDMGFFNSALNLSFDYYTRNTIGMLTESQELPGVLGTNPPDANAADLQTRGWELTLGYKHSTQLGGSPFSFGTSLILSDSKSRITRFDNDGQLFSQWREGQDIGEIWGLENDGLFETQDEIDQLDQSAIVPWGALSIVPGWPKYVDQDGDGKILRGQSATDPKDLKLIGNTQPRYQIGFNLNASWKGFDFSSFLQGIGKRDYYPTNYLFWGAYQQPYANMYPHLLDFYRATSDSDALRAQHSQSYIDAGLADANTDSEYPVLQSWLADSNYGAGLDIPQTKYLKSAAYLRVKNITLGYTLPETLLEKIKVSQLRFFVTGENIYEWSNIKKFVDPEATGSRGYAYPFHRKLSVGMNITF